MEDQPGAVQPVAADVDLNPVRAGLTPDPKDPCWCGYGQAVAEHERAREGLASFHLSAYWEVLGP